MNSNLSQPARVPSRGLRPVKQRRSTRTRDKLLEAANRLIVSATFENLSVAEIAKAAGCSVGAFYGRFEDKEALFCALVLDMVEEVRANLRETYEKHQGEDLIAHLVKGGVSNFRRRAGLLRAAARKGMEDAEAWRPIREHGYFAASLMIRRMEQDASRRLSKQEAIGVRFAFQMFHGTLINTLINDPGPVKLKDPIFESELARAFRQVLPAGLLSVRGSRRPRSAGSARD